MLTGPGPLLSIDVGARTAETEPIEGVRSRYLGGRGVGTKLVYDRVPFDVDPLGSDNAVVFSAGPLQASRTSYTGRLNCTGVSPLSDGLVSSNAGGFLSRPFLNTGYGAIEVTGASDRLLAVHVTDDGVEFEAVPELAGATVPDVTAHVEDEHGLDASHVACIGPAGENEVRFAAIVTSGSRVFGRGGLGAVLGAKNVKLLTFAGDAAPEVDGPDIGDEIRAAAAEADHVMKEQGTAALTAFADEIEALPTRYYGERSFEGVDGIAGERVAEKKYKKGTCSSCAFACKLPTRDEASGLETEGPEFETVMAFGSNVGVDDIVDVMSANDRCDALGLDTISCGAAVAAYLASEDAFGDAALVRDLIEKIAHREGVGDLLAEGVARCHDDLGVPDWSMKDVAFPAHDGRRLNGQALAYATSNRGADHLYGSLYVYEYPMVDQEKALPPDGVDGKIDRLVRTENTKAALDSAILCKFSRTTAADDRLPELLETTDEALQRLGERIVTLERDFNARRGFDRADDDDLPYEIEGLADALDEYYRRRGWNRDGTVPAATLDELEIEA
ncbi:aldehyde ferredoxin oxidoreductase family protein [Natrinema salifodinae]|uniref:Aldehyde:ferredoxin oxidoreductase n=1 Tax=Natrinema salifodinae TaxID=1202768 RepID=A0A1I0PJ60_9EURY|nr:aldehyde ferredoxin oxidoreductase C-terminal domain-containing protein [Natrinema salifodinae]SEW14312.1 aldehyde:ferredoxin oxidoreductase [Natrinema salifodinae]